MDIQMSKEKQTILEELSRFAETFAYEDFTVALLEEIKLLVLDTIGAILASKSTALGEMATRLVPPSRTPEEATAIATGTKTDLLSAIQANCTAAHCSEIDCIHPRAIVCLGGMVFPAALAWAERTRKTGKELITAIAVGCEISIRLGTSAEAQELLAAGWWPSSIFGPIGACAAIGKLEGLSCTMLRNAMAINSTVCGGLINGNSEGATARHFLYGWVARSAAVSVLAAKEGFTGASDGLEIRQGLFYSRGAVPDFSETVSGLGTAFHLNEIAYKEFASAMQSQSAVHGFLNLVSQYNVTEDTIASVVLRLPEKALTVVSGEGYPETHTAAAAHGRYLLAAAMCDGDVLPKQFNEDRLGDPHIRAFAERIRVEGDSNLDQYIGDWPARVEIRLKDGRIAETEVVDWMGCDGRKDFVERKFKRIAREMLSAQKLEAIFAAVEKLENLEDISVLIRAASLQNV
jgi:2-methylcitrate dehydratase PrpD